MRWIKHFSETTLTVQLSFVPVCFTNDMLKNKGCKLITFFFLSMKKKSTCHVRGEPRCYLCPPITQQDVSKALFTLFAVRLTNSSFMRLKDFCGTLTCTKFREHRRCSLSLILSLWERRDQAIGLLQRRQVVGKEYTRLFFIVFKCL